MVKEFIYNSWTRLNLLKQWQIVMMKQVLGEFEIVYPLSHIMDLILLTTRLKVHAYKLDTYTYNIEFALVVCCVSRSSIKGCIHSCYCFPGTMQIICHYVDEIQISKITKRLLIVVCISYICSVFLSLYQLYENWSITLAEISLCLMSNSLVHIWCTHALWTYFPSAGTS
jgi:hypothetical protein